MARWRLSRRSCTAAIVRARLWPRWQYRTSSVRAASPTLPRVCKDSPGVNTALSARPDPVNDSARRDAFGAQLESWQNRMERALAARLPEASLVPQRLHEAMRYSVLGGGKRIRPAL